MSLIKAVEIEIGIIGQRITIRGSRPPDPGKSYGEEKEFEIDLAQAREMHRLLGRLIPLAEKSRTAAPIIALQTEESA